ncbi:ERF superfamily protein [Pseudonocardia sediminis]|uniref:ERF superfamily protein n=1 Tax=Pseudonocardia sediminis TaxID=1397368 RepID=A0A4Q7UZI1_PSEST|nr:ERF family protein [Pseudonocardia sediminis]RZT87552.1 ERF superfamily protein [Pseudonocardia sediminis]
MTDTKPTVVEAMAAVMEDVRAVAKNDRNQQQQYAFRGIDAVVNAVGPIFRKHQVVPMPVLESVNYRDVQTSNGKPSRECTVTVRYRFFGPAGDSIDAVTPGESMDFGDKGAPKAMSVAYRIALLQALCLPTSDTDPDAETYERAIGSGQPPPQRETKQPPADTVAAARVVLANRAKAAKIPIETVAAEYLSRTQTDITKETDPKPVRAFIAAWDKGQIEFPEPAASS